MRNLRLSIVIGGRDFLGNYGLAGLIKQIIHPLIEKHIVMMNLRFIDEV